MSAVGHKNGTETWLTDYTSKVTKTFSGPGLGKINGTHAQEVLRFLPGSTRFSKCEMFCVKILIIWEHIFTP